MHFALSGIAKRNTLVEKRKNIYCSKIFQLLKIINKTASIPVKEDSSSHSKIGNSKYTVGKEQVCSVNVKHEVNYEFLLDTNCCFGYIH